jgi:hypothetical protein
MEDYAQQKILEFLKASFDPDGTLHFLAVSAVKVDHWDSVQATLYKVRTAITFQDGDEVDPYFDGTDLYVIVTPSEIVFANEGDWAEGPPIVEGSPNKLAIKWVSELAPPFWVSAAAIKASDECQSV